MRLSGKFTIIFSQNFLCANLLTCLVIGQKEQQTWASSQYIANYILQDYLIQIPYFYYIFLWHTYMKWYEIIWNIIFILIFMQFYKNSWFMACTLTNMDRNHYNIMVFGCLVLIMEVVQFTTTEEIEIFHFRWGINAYLLPT